MRIYEIYYLDSFGNVENSIKAQCSSKAEAICKAFTNRGNSVKVVIQSLRYEDPEIIRETIYVCNYV